MRLGNHALIAVGIPTTTARLGEEARKSVAVLTQEARRLVKGVDELLRDATGGRTANIYEFAGGSVAYFAPDAPDFQEAGELKGDDLAEAVRILNGSGVPGGNPVQLE